MHLIKNEFKKNTHFKKGTTRQNQNINLWMPNQITKVSDVWPVETMNAHEQQFPGPYAGVWDATEGLRKENEEQAKWHLPQQQRSSPSICCTICWEYVYAILLTASMLKKKFQKSQQPT